jgi:hypothetical protein
MNNIKVKWNEDDEFAGFEGDPGDVPKAAIGSDGADRSACAIVSNGDTRFEEPIWLPSDLAYELSEAGIIDFDDAYVTGFDFNGLRVYIYTAGF